MASIRETLKELIARVCGDIMAGEVPDDARVGDPAGWDSLTHVALVALLEETFDRPVSPAEIARLTSLQAIERWVAGEADVRPPVTPPTTDEVARALRSAGLERGDVAMVHSFTASLGVAQRPDRVLIDALLDVLGPEGTLVLPAFTYSFCRTGIFEPDRSPSEVGIASDTLREEYSGVRSGCPIFSVVAVGPLADEIATLRPETTFGADSIFGLMLRRRGKLCAVGVGFEKVTFNHYPEQELEVPYRHWKRFEGVIKREEREEPVAVEYYVRSLDPEAEQDFTSVHRLISRKDFAGRATVGGAEIHCAPVEDYHRVLRGALEEDPLLLLTPRSRRHWRADAPKPDVDRLRGELSEAPDDLELARELADALIEAGEAAEAQRVVTQAATAAGDYGALTGACRWAREILPAAQAEEGARVSVTWTGAETLEPLAETAETYARAQCIIPATRVGDFGQFRSDLLRGDADADIIFVRVGPEALAPELDGWRYGGGDPGVARDAARELCALVDRWLERSRGHAVVHLPAPWHRSALGVADGELAEGARAVAAAFNDELARHAGDEVRAHVLDEAAAMLRAGARAVDPALRYHAGIDLSGAGIAAVGREASRFVIATRRRPVKCIVVDLDNTLWGGIVGEDGVTGLSLAGEYPGEAHRELQRWLLAHQDAGVLLAICSKNERADGLAPFERRPDMLLRPEHFAAVSIDWRPKPARIPEIAHELNIGIDSLVFIDDSPFERAAMREAVPEVTVPELPEDVSRWVEHLSDLHLSDALTLTEEDRRRASMYAEDRERKTRAEAAGDMEAFLGGLESVATVYCDEPALLARTAQLCARTNQFNLSSRRHSEGRLREFINDEDARVVQMRAADRFGDLGVVGVAIVRAQDEMARLDTLLLSCRALGRGFEDALLAEAWRRGTEELDADGLLAPWIDNGRNGQVREFLRRPGAKAQEAEDDAVGNADAMAYLVDGPVTWPEHVKRVEGETTGASGNEEAGR